MEIVSKFSGKCTACNGPVASGDRVNWIKGVKGVTHVQCPTAETLELQAANETLFEAGRLHEQIASMSDTALYRLLALLMDEQDKRRKAGAPLAS